MAGSASIMTSMPLLRDREAEGQQHLAVVKAEAVFAEGRIEKRNIGNAVRNDRDLVWADTHVAQQNVAPHLGHDDDPRGGIDNAGKDTALFGGGVGQHRVKRRHQRRPELAQQGQQIVAGGCRRRCHTHAAGKSHRRWWY